AGDGPEGRGRAVVVVHRRRDRTSGRVVREFVCPSLRRHCAIEQENHWCGWREERATPKRSRRFPMFSIEWRNGIVDYNAGVLARAVWLAVLVVVATESLSATELISDLNVAGKPSEFDGFEDDAVVFDDRYYIFGADDPI